MNEMKIKLNIFKVLRNKFKISKTTDSFVVHWSIAGNMITFTGTGLLTGENLENFGLSSGSLIVKPEIVEVPDQPSDEDYDDFHVFPIVRSD